MSNLKKMSVVKKALIGMFTTVLVVFLFYDISKLPGLIVNILVLYFIIIFINSLFSPSPQKNSEIGQDDDYTAQKEEDERLSQENIANQEALDRLL